MEPAAPLPSGPDAIPGRARLRRQRGTTIADVAHIAGVSVSTVSRVVRGKGEVGAETHARIEQIISETGYRPSSVARALVSGTTNTLGLLVDDLTNPFYPQLAMAIEQEARRHGYTVVICNTNDVPDDSLRDVKRLLDQGVDGLIHASVGLDEEAVLEALGDSRRIVFTNRRPLSPGVSYVTPDNRAGSTALTRLLLEMGHRKIGFIAGPMWASNNQDRLAGFAEAMEVSGGEALIAPGGFVLEGGRQIVSQWVAEQNLPTAVIGVNDVVALGALTGLAAAGIAVPRQVAVAGFDDILLAGSSFFGLTSVDLRTDEMGHQAVQVLLGRLSGDLKSPVQVQLEPHVIVRSTTVSIPRSSTPGQEYSTVGSHLDQR